MFNETATRRPERTGDLYLVMYDIVCENSQIRRSELLNMLLEIDARWSIFFFTERVGPTLTYPDQVRISQCATEAEAEEMKRQLVRDRQDEFKINWGVISAMKSWINRHLPPELVGGRIYGASNMGYVTGDNMTHEEPARWLYSRIKAISNAEADYRNVSRMLRENSVTQNQRGLASEVCHYVNDGLYSHDLASMAVRLNSLFINPDGL